MICVGACGAARLAGRKPRRRACIVFVLQGWGRPSCATPRTCTAQALATPLLEDVGHKLGVPRRAMVAASWASFWAARHLRSPANMAAVELPARCRRIHLATSLYNGQLFGWKSWACPGNSERTVHSGVIADDAGLSWAISLQADAQGFCEPAAFVRSTGPLQPALAALAAWARLHSADHLCVVDDASIADGWAPHELDRASDACAGQAPVRDVFQQLLQALPGVCVWRQDPWTSLVSFILSSNNNVKRIDKMVQAVRVHIGHRLPLGAMPADFPGPADAWADVACSSGLPSPSTLSRLPIEHLQTLGLGYRAKFLLNTAAAVVLAGSKAAAPADSVTAAAPGATVGSLDAGAFRWLHSLRAADPADQLHQLCALSGVGRKVADCVRLFGLDCRDVVPIDTHMWAIAKRELDPSLPTRTTLTPKMHDAAQALYVHRFGRHAGWAHSLLFAGELPDFRARLPELVLAHQAAYRAEQAEAKAGKKRARTSAHAGV